MRRVIIDQDIPLAIDRRLIKRLWKVDKKVWNLVGRFNHGISISVERPLEECVDDILAYLAEVIR